MTDSHERDALCEAVGRALTASRRLTAGGVAPDGYDDLMDALEDLQRLLGTAKEPVSLLSAARSIAAEVSEWPEWKKAGFRCRRAASPPRNKQTLPKEIKSFGEAVRYLRKQRGMTLRALAREIDVAAPFLSDIEHNRRRTNKIAELAEALGCEKELLSNLDGRMSADLKDWVQENPTVVRFLEEVRNSGASGDELQLLLRGES